MDKARTDRRNRELQRLQMAVAKQQAEMAQSRPVDGSPSERIRPVVGMPADIVLTLKGYSKKDRLRSPVVVGYDRFGLKVKWYYHDVTLLLKRIEAGGCIKVVEVKERGNDDGAENR